MDAARNPYSPGAGLRPPALVGRDAEIAKVRALVARAANRRSIARGLVLSGLRGVGKTVLLNELASIAEDNGWIVGRVEAQRKGAGESLDVLLARSLRGSLRKVSRRYAATEKVKGALGSFKSFSLGLDPTGSLSLGIDIDPQRGRADNHDLAADLVELAEDLGDAAKEQGAAAALFVDEMQDADLPVLRALIGAAHAAAQVNRPFYVFGAGLPSLPGHLGDAVTYTERLFEYRTIEHLTEFDSRIALTEPAQHEGVQWEEDAASTIVRESAGYPYFLQEYGRAAWDAAIGPASITQSDVLVAVTEGRAALDAGFFRGRWDRATPAEHDYLGAMAVDGGGPSSSSEIAGRLGRPLTSLGPARANLIAKGLIYSPEHGRIAYTVPGMADFVNRQR